MLQQEVYVLRAPYHAEIDVRRLQGAQMEMMAERGVDEARPLRPVSAPVSAVGLVSM